METLNYNKKNIKIIDEADVIVVGGGTSGVVAAISALEEKKSVIVLEKSIVLGGSATRALVTPHMITRVGTGKLHRKLNEEYLKYDKNASDNLNIYALHINGETYAEFIEDKILKLGGKIYYEATFIDVIKNNNKIEYVLAYIFNDLYAIKGKVFVDTSAEALVAKSVGIEIQSGDENNVHQSASLRFEMANVDKQRLVDFLKKINYYGFGIPEDPNKLEFIKDPALEPYFKKAIENNDIKKSDVSYIQAFQIPGKPNLFSFNNPQIPNTKDVCNPKDFSYYVIEGRKSVNRFANFLIKYIPGFEHAYICQIASMLGIRESVRIVGDYILTEKDYLKQAKFDDGIAKADWYVDVHHDDDKYDIKVNEYHYKPGEYYEVPYRCLISKHCDNLICGGRIISTSFKVEASVRIQATLHDIAEVIGKACAYSLNNNIDLNKINGKVLRTFE